MKLCGCKEKCFKNGDIHWSEYGSVVCLFYCEINKNDKCTTICEINKKEIKSYITEYDYEKIKYSIRKDKLERILI